MKISVDELESREASLVATGSWKWGTTETYHVQVDGADYIATLRLHYSDGVQDDEVELIPAKRVEKHVTIWVRA
jgi:hypothetical protein